MVSQEAENGTDFSRENCIVILSIQGLAGDKALESIVATEPTQCPGNTLPLYRCSSGSPQVNVSQCLQSPLGIPTKFLPRSHR